MPTPGDVWNPDQYGKFRDERSAPFHDLLALVRRGDAPRIVDLGCGTGELTRARAPGALRPRDAWASTRRPRCSRRRRRRSGGGLSFRPGRHRGLRRGRLGRRALRTRRSTGCPITRRSSPASPRSSRRGASSRSRSPPTTRTPPTRSQGRSRASRPSPVRSAGTCGSRRSSRRRGTRGSCSSSGSSEQRVRVEVYAHRLAARDDVVEWVRGTYLTDFQKRLDGPTWERFLARYREKLLAALPDEHPFLYTYRRVFVWGRAPETTHEAAPRRAPAAPSRRGRHSSRAPKAAQRRGCPPAGAGRRVGAT